MFERLGIFYKNAGARALPGTDHDRCRRRQAKRAGAGDDEYGDGVDQRFGKIGAVHPPADEGKQGNAANHRHEDRRDTVGQTLHWRFRALRLGDQANDAGEQRMFADTGRPAAQHAFAIGRRRKYTIAATLANRHALAGQHRLIHTRSAADHLTIDRHVLTGADDENIARHQQRRVDFH